jgi:uncharacterized protein
MNQQFDSRGILQGPMHSDVVTPPGASTPGGAPPPPGSKAEAAVASVFVGRSGIRAGWRLLIFVAIAFVLLAIYGIVVKAVHHGQVPRQINFSSVAIATGDGALFLVFLVASWIMTPIEKRTIGDYGLPWRKAFGKEFWQGAVVGFVAMSGLLVALRVLGVFSFGSMALHGVAIVKYAVAFGVAFLLVGFAEEYSVRGYPLFTLTTGIGFWPAAILLSIAFGALHLGNGGEDWVGALSAGSAGFLFCFILRRTGSLWMPIGFHMAWDWAETFFYGVPDSGLSAPGHMLNPSFHGSKLLTGGSVGPEGSVLVFVVLLLCWLFFHFWLPEVKYPSPAALRAKPRWAQDSQGVSGPPI